MPPEKSLSSPGKALKDCDGDGKNHQFYLALLHFHYNTPINLDKVVGCYAQLYPRWLALDQPLLS